MKNTEPKKIKKYKAGTTALYILLHPYILLTLVSFIKTVLIDFFISQFARKLGLTKTPIAKVDNELDNKIPFNPNKVGIYMDFTAFWIRPLSMIIKRLGYKKAKPYVIAYLNKIKLAYSSAGKVYKICMSTTDRPHYNKKFYFRVIHVFDPHYLCVPSLHICVVSLVWSFYRQAFKEIEEIPQKEKDMYLQEMYDDAIKIAETVLYIKQHSVNCIPAALYMMTFLMKPYFTVEDGINFLNDMFKSSSIPEKDLKEIRDYMYFILERLSLVGISDDNWISPIKAWMKEYCINANQAYIANKIK